MKNGHSQLAFFQGFKSNLPSKKWNIQSLKAYDVKINDTANFPMNKIALSLPVYYKRNPQDALEQGL